MPGQATIVFHDATGRIIYFQLEEGKGDIRKAIQACTQAVQTSVAEARLLIYDRESWGVAPFIEMAPYRLLTWEKHTAAAEINALPIESFSEACTTNEQHYRVYELPEKHTYFNADKSSLVALRRIVIWNRDSKRRPVCVSNDAHEDATFLGRATFKVIGREGKNLVHPTFAYKT